MALYNIYLSPPSIPGSSACREEQSPWRAEQSWAGREWDALGWGVMGCRRGPAPSAAGVESAVLSLDRVAPACASTSGR